MALVALFFYTLLILPLAHPFVSGSSSNTAASSSTWSTTTTTSLAATPSSSSTNSPRRQPRRSRLFAPRRLTESLSGVESLRRRQWWRFPGRTTHHDNKDLTDASTRAAPTETTTTTTAKTLAEFPWWSRLLFSYSIPLLQTAQDRHLQVDDAFGVPSHQQMESSVTRLSEIHARLQRESSSSATLVPPSHQPQKEQAWVSSQAWLLTKALMLHQRRALITTGLLRLVNTAIQAFPALLVARLLRLAEAGTTVPATKAIQAALALVSVLSLKMMVENQYFHQVVQCATAVRGSVSGLVFDKALALPGGGSGVRHPTTLVDRQQQTNNKNNKNNNKALDPSAASTTTAPTTTTTTTTTTTAPIGSGGVLNLMQSDAGLLELAALQIHTTWDGVLQLAVYTSLLVRVLGPSALYGCAVLVATIPLNSWTLRLLNRLSRYENQAKDARTKRTTESIAHMKLLKLFGWQDNFAQDIEYHRQEELQRHVARGVVRALNSAISNAVPALVLVVTLRAYARTGAPIVASTIFTAISLFHQLRFPLFFYPMLIDALANGRNAMVRIANFVATPETVPYVQHLPAVEIAAGTNPHYNKNQTAASLSSSVDPSSTTGGGAIAMQHGNFLWSVSQGTPSNDKKNMDPTNQDKDDNNDETRPVVPSSSSIPALARVNFQVSPGEMVAVVGSVGAGKSALIQALLGELNPVPSLLMEQALSHSTEPNAATTSTDQTATTLLPSPDQSPVVTIHGEVAYCSQEAWLPKGTIREAITFGREYDETRYRAAIRDAGLDKDIAEESTNGDDNSHKGPLRHDTNVGEHGSSLSGGQRARVALARALYAAHAKVFLLDDCLAALDASVGSTVFERLSQRFRAQNAAVLLVTNDPSLPRRCDRTILMGRVNDDGSSSSSCCTIVDSGSYDELLARGHDLSSFAPSDENDDDNDVANQSHVAFDHGGSSKKVYPVTKQQQQQQQQAFQSTKSAEPPKLMKLNKHNIIHVGNNAAGPSNGTCVSSNTCHSNPDSTLVVMENCPVTVYEGSMSDMDDEESESGSIFVDFCYNNNTDPVDAAVQNVAVNPSTPVVSASSSDTSPKASSPKALKSMDESMTTGAVPFSTYVSYFKAVRKPLLIAAMLVSFLTVNGAQFFQQYTVARWSDAARDQTLSAAVGAGYMRSLVSAVGVVSVFLWIRSFLSMQVGVRASEFLHSRMLSSVFAAPLSFFDSTDSGQLLSRFGKETETVDRGVPDSIQSTLFCFLQIFMSMGALTGVISPAMLFPLVTVGFLYARTMSLFRPAARDLKRAEAKTRSPIYTHFGEALRGAETIRSIPGAKRTWSSMHRSLTDANLGVFYTVKALDRWLSTRLETLGNVVVLMVAMASIYLTRTDRLGAGSAGWGLTQALSVTGLLTWAVRCLTDLETNMMSVLRVNELTNVDAEEPKDKKSSLPTQSLMPREPANAGEALAPLIPNPQFKAALAPSSPEALLKSGWPWRGNIRFKNVSMRYNPTAPLVLRNVSLTVPAGTTLGVVGRTGSGKSSLLLTVFRIMEIEPDGSIEIDGVDIRALSLKTLRQSLAIIPQDPTLFQGTVASNLDATGVANEQDMWTALQAASPALARQFRDDAGLESIITEGGKNLSQGQRQLICLARALLRKSKILVLDEATSSVDSKTDQEVQATIRREFVDKGVTVITVAHRLDTVLGYDNIAVLGGGSVLEYGSPKQLLQNPNGELRQLVEADRESKRKGAQTTNAGGPTIQHETAQSTEPNIRVNTNNNSKSLKTARSIPS